MDEIHSFYSDLYSKKNSEELIVENCPFLNSGNLSKLSQAGELTLAGQLTLVCYVM